MEEEKQAEEKQAGFQSFWVVIPTLLLEDEKISIKAKRLYALISSLCKKEGYCWASNKFLSETLNIPLSTIRFSLKKLEKGKWIQSEVNKEEGNVRKIFLRMPNLYNQYIKKEPPLCQTISIPYANALEQKKQSYANALEQKIPNNNIDNNNIYIYNISYKEIGKTTSSYGNEDINYLMAKFQEITGLKKMDGSIKQNRRYCWLLLKKVGGRKENAENLIKLAVKEPFHRANLTSFKYLYYNAVKILNQLKVDKETPKAIEIKIKK